MPFHETVQQLAFNVVGHQEWYSPFTEFRPIMMMILYDYRTVAQLVQFLSIALCSLSLGVAIKKKELCSALYPGGYLADPVYFSLVSFTEKTQYDVLVSELPSGLEIVSHCCRTILT